MATEWNKPMQWDNEGVEPSENLKRTGFVGGYKPPASIFNYFLHMVEKCIKQIQSVVDLKSDNTHGHDNATSAKDGFMSKTDCEYLSKIKPVIQADVDKKSVNMGENNTLLDGNYKYVFVAGNDNTVEGENVFVSGNKNNTEGIGGNAFVAGYRNTVMIPNAYVLGEGHFVDYSPNVSYPYLNRAFIGQFSEGLNDANNIFVVGNGSCTEPDEETINITRSNAFRTTSTGRSYGALSFAGSGADFCEYFEWKDGNTENADRRGLFVSFDGEKIKLADAGDDVLGIVSATPCFCGDIASENWHEKYLKDVFGQRLTEIVKVPEKTDEKTGKTIPAHTEERFIINPEYDPKKPYTSREYRKEWSAVGLLGKIVAVDDGTCESGKYCSVSKNGVATISETKTKFYVMNRIDKTHIRVFVGI